MPSGVTKILSRLLSDPWAHLSILGNPRGQSQISLDQKGLLTKVVIHDSIIIKILSCLPVPKKVCVLAHLGSTLTADYL